MKNKDNIGSGLPEGNEPEKANIEAIDTKTANKETMTIPEDDPESKRKISKGTFASLLTADFMLVIAVIVVVAGIFRYIPDDKQTKVTPETEDIKPVGETGQDTETLLKTVSVMGVNNPDETGTAETDSSDMEEETGDSELTPDDSWQDTIFGTEESSVIHTVKVSGLTEVQKVKIGYRESDFLSALSAFLSDNGITGVKEAVFEEEIACSSQNAYAFRVSLTGAEDFVLTAIMYPDYPGRFLLSAIDSGEIIGETVAYMEEETEETAAETERSVQAETSAPAQPQTETTSSQETQGSTSAASDYDANTLSVTGIPATLLNYISNRYEMQYTLYSYLYHNGRKDITSATVSSYEIDPDTRVATISFTLSDGSSLTGNYDWNNNTYSYY